MATCAICLSEFRASSNKTIVSLLCGHVFDRDCLETWFRHEPGDRIYGKKCPTCRKPTSRVAQRVLYMQFESGDVTGTSILEDSNVNATPPGHSNQLEQTAEVSDQVSDRDFEVGLLQAQLASVESALVESANVQNNLESLNNDLKRQMADKDAEKERLVVLNHEMRAKMQSAVKDADRLKTASALLKISATDLAAKIHEFSSNPEKSDRDIIAALVTSIICKDKELCKEKGLAKIDRKHMESLNREIVGLKAQIKELQKTKTFNEALELDDDSSIQVLDSDDSSDNEPTNKSHKTAVKRSAGRTKHLTPTVGRRLTVAGTSIASRGNVENFASPAYHRPGLAIKKSALPKNRLQPVRNTKKPVLRSNSIQNK
ncbi:uncharacterized protein LOC142338431 [Convolutriloba macropyga]|uniref:uncharacterized protein LOC142338431 n=1 Tax=Convolutriloba macropyga TaxID=536237 RepID=UPI003F51EF45